jgi:hypothetical protein
MRTARLLVTLSSLAGAGIPGVVSAQAMPTTQPGLLTIIREEVKLGRSADHEKVEAGWPAAFEKARSPVSYLALTAMTGTNEVWYVVPYASHAAAAEDMKRNESDAALSAELARLSAADAEFLNAVRTIQASARPDLSFGTFPDMAMERFWEITIFRVRPGHEPQFEAAAQAYGAASRRAAPENSYRVYEVIAGMPGPTYLIFGSVRGYAAFDDMMARGQRTMQGMTPEEMNTLMTFAREALISAESNRYRLSPSMSYVDQATKAKDPAFWTQK